MFGQRIRPGFDQDILTTVTDLNTVTDAGGAKRRHMLTIITTPSIISRATFIGANSLTVAALAALYVAGYIRCLGGRGCSGRRGGRWTAAYTLATESWHYWTNVGAKVWWITGVYCDTFLGSTRTERGCLWAVADAIVADFITVLIHAREPGHVSCSIALCWWRFRCLDWCL